MRPLGQIPSMGTPREQLRMMRTDRLGGLHRANAQGHDMSRMRFLFGDVVLVNTPELVHEVLVAHARSFEKSPILRAALHPLVGQGIFTSEGELWKRQRKIMAPLFQPANLGRYADAMRACTERVVREWKNGEIVDISREMTRITMNIAGETLFGVDLDDDAEELGEALSVALEWAGIASSDFTMIAQARVKVGLERLADKVPPSWSARVHALAEKALVPIRWPGERTRSLEAALEVVETTVTRLIAERRKDPTSRFDLLSLLLRTEGEDGAMSDRQVRDEVVTLFVAGHETTATALTWAFMLLAQHPEIAARLRTEVLALAHPPTAADLPRLDLASRIFKESMRLYPPVYMFGRVAITDVVVGSYELPKGTVVLVSPFALHRNPRFWVDPERFDPDRFLPSEEAKRHRTTFIPFSAGPRTCIGNTFALMEGPIVMATLLRHADITLVDGNGTVPEPLATLRPKDGMPMRVRLRAS